MMSVAADAIREWLTRQALPLWANLGVDPRGGFVERFTIAGVPDLDAPKRLLVQARQIYVYSHAYLIGLEPAGIEVAWRGFQFAKQSAWTPAEGWAHLLTPGGHVLNAKRDCYDHAFVLFALAWLYRATRDNDVRETIDDTVAFMDRHLSHPCGFGYREDLSGTVPRRQNPHMHLLEAWLALYEATGDEQYIIRARQIVRMLESIFFERSCNALREYFTDDLQRPADDSTDFFEPGHHFEWFWLLHRYARLSGEKVPSEASLLLRTAVRHGFSEHGIVVDEVWMRGGFKKGSARCWPQTEALKASLFVNEDEPLSRQLDPDAIIARLFAHHLSGPVPGAWWDVLDPQARPCADKIPATTLYHLFLAFSEYLAVRGSNASHGAG